MAHQADISERTSTLVPSALQKSILAMHHPEQKTAYLNMIKANSNNTFKVQK